jgi:cysteine desulfuration protein SufE
MDKYEYLMELGRDLLPYDPRYKIDKYLIDGCQSRVWLYSVVDNDTIKYFADSDAIIIKGMIALLIRVFSNQRPADVVAAKLFFIDKIELQENLSTTRSNGLASMIKRMRALAAESK